MRMIPCGCVCPFPQNHIQTTSQCVERAFKWEHTPDLNKTASNGIVDATTCTCLQLIHVADVTAVDSISDSCHPVLIFNILFFPRSVDFLSLDLDKKTSQFFQLEMNEGFV